MCMHEIKKNNVMPNGTLSQPGFFTLISRLPGFMSNSVIVGFSYKIGWMPNG